MLKKARNYMYWATDSLKGGKVEQAYNDINRYYYLDSDSELLLKYKKTALEKLLQHATNTTLFYKDFKEITEINNFPVVNKNVIRENQEEFLSNQYNKESLIEMSTSGSTGTPFTSYQNIEKKRRVNAETIFFNGKAGYSVGNQFIYLRSINIKSKKSKLQQWIQNQRLIDIDHLSDDDIKILLEQIESFTSKDSATLLSYASTYDALRDYFTKKGKSSVKKSRLNGIISTSEILFDETRDSMMKAFGCNVYSRYANMENGILGQDEPSHPNTFILNEANYYYEILDQQTDEPVKEGEIGRIVITDLYNYAMPMIRYDTGDVGTFTYIEVNGVQKKAITNFGGRMIDMIYDCYQNYVSPHKISVTFWNFPELNQFQFIQESEQKYRVLLNTYKRFEREEELRSKLKEILGEQAIISFDMVKEIPTLDSGKRKYIVNKTLEN